MNKNFVKLAFVGIACAAFCTVTFAAPKGGNRNGNHSGNGRPARVAHAPKAARPAAEHGKACRSRPACQSACHRKA